MSDRREQEAEKRRPILVNHVVRADGTRTRELKVFCRGRDTTVPLDICRDCPRCHQLEIGDRDGQGWIRCTPPGEAEEQPSAGDAMSEGAVVVEEDVLVRDLVTIFAERRLRIVVVVDPEGRVSGVVHDSHLLPHIQAHVQPGCVPAAIQLEWAIVASSTASEVMSSARPIAEGTSVREALAQMAEIRHQRLVVIDAAGLPLGVLADVHALRALRSAI
jgi:CBS domain-containing protein